MRAGAAELGFAEEAPAWRLRSSQFPSKVGGRPAWLGEAGLPGPAELACSLCGRPLAFVLQLYAPLPGRADAFHRGLFLFCCRAPPCCAGLRGERRAGATRSGRGGRGGLPGFPSPPSSPGFSYPAGTPCACSCLDFKRVRFQKAVSPKLFCIFSSVGLNGNWIDWLREPARCGSQTSL